MADAGGDKKRILLVDDEVSFTRLLKINLEQTNRYEVRVENWAEDAVKSAQEFKPHLIILDVLMPRVFGGEVASRLKMQPELRDVPIVFLSATVGKERVNEHGGIISGNPFLAKPATVEEVVSFIERNLPKQKAPPPGR
jgi:CheY-like chemotaxis protein